MRLEQNDIDIDNFIKEKIGSRRSRRLIVEPSPDFSRRTMDGIYRLEKRRRLLALYGWAALWALGPLALRQGWLLIRNDYFAAGRLPFSGLIIVVYQFFLSWVGALLLLAMGVFASLLFVFKLRHGSYYSPIKTVKV